MDEAKKKLLEAKLRQMFLKASQTSEDDRPAPMRKPRVIRVIRRRKGQPDTQIA